jgi:hypothetical protein
MAEARTQPLSVEHAQGCIQFFFCNPPQGVSAACGAARFLIKHWQIPRIRVYPSVFVLSFPSTPQPIAWNLRRAVRYDALIILKDTVYSHRSSPTNHFEGSAL